MSTRLQSRRNSAGSPLSARTLMVAAFLISAVGCASAADAPGGFGVHAQAAEIGSVVKRYPPGSIKSVEIADQVLAESGRERNAIEARYAQEEQRCNPKFFSSSCIEDANDARREAMRQLRSVEIEANKVKRAAKVSSREEALAAKQEREGASSQEQGGAVRDSTAGNSPGKAEPIQDAVTPKPAPKPLPSGKPRGSDRIAEHEEKMQVIKEKEAAEADKRAKNIAAYERKVREADERQKEIAKRKEEKARKLEEKRQRAAESAAK